MNANLMNLNRNDKMSSREIAEITGKQHSHVMDAIRTMESAWEKVGQSKFRLTSYFDQWNREQPMYELDKAECLYVATKFNDEARAKLIIRWQELENVNIPIDFTNPDVVLQIVQNWKQSDEKAKRLEADNYRKEEIIEIQHETINELAPKADYTEKVLKSKDVITTTQVAKELGYSAQTLNKILNSLRVQYKMGGQWVLFSKYQDKGYTKTHTFIEEINGETRTWHSTVWTEKGRKFIHEILKNHYENQLI